MIRASLSAVSWQSWQSSLGWMAVLWGPGGVRRIAFGHASQAAARRAIEVSGHPQTPLPTAAEELTQRLLAYADGQSVDFQDVPVDLPAATAFQRRVYAACRRIPWGRTRTYAQLAASVSSPAAARAVGTCMARNPVPLVVPCHRVVGSGGGLGGFSAPGGTRLKRRLLDLESGAPAGLI